MFSGIIESLGTVEALEPRGDDARLVVRHGFGDVELTLGESICTSGVCLTVVDRPSGRFVADLSGETLRRSTLGRLVAGAVVNLERSLRLGDRLSGHFVFGHVEQLSSQRGTVAGFAWRRILRSRRTSWTKGRSPWTESA